VEEKKHSLEKVWRYVASLVALLNALAALILQIIDWRQDVEKMRYVSLAPFLIFLATALWFARQAWAKRQEKRLWMTLAMLFIVSCGYAFLWGIWFEPPKPGCRTYDIRITAPLTGALIPGGETEVRGTLHGKPPEGSIVLLVRLPDGSHNWPQGAPLQVDPVLGTWRGRVALGGEPLQTHLVAVAYLGRSGRILVDYFFKVGRETNGWPSLELLPDDVEICDEITVHR